MQIEPYTHSSILSEGFVVANLTTLREFVRRYFGLQRKVLVIGDARLEPFIPRKLNIVITPR